jgi:hypothetical protein
MQATSPKTAKLEKGIQDIQAFLADKLDRHRSFPSIAQELEKIAASLKAGKLTIQVFSQYQKLMQVLQNGLTAHKALAEIYQVKALPLPKQPEPTPPSLSAALVYQVPTTEETAYTEVRYALSANRTIRIGRSPDCEIFLSTKQYPFISWQHAEIQPLLDISAAKTCSGWSVNDLHSTNGTYINSSSEKLQGNHTLKTGDRITLASTSPTQTNLEFVFECHAEADATGQGIQQPVLNGDIACLVVSANQPLSDDEQYFLQQAGASAAKLIVIAVTENEAQTVQFPTKLEQEIRNQQTNLEFERFTLCLNAPLVVSEVVKPAKAITQRRLRKVVDSPVEQSESVESAHSSDSAPETHSQQEFDRLCQWLEEVATRKPEEVLTKRITTQAQQYLGAIEQILTEQEETFKKQIQQEEEKPQEAVQNSVDVKRMLKQLNETRDSFFKQIKPHLNRAKGAVLDEYSPKSVLHKIQLYIDDLRVVEFKQDGYKYVQLEPKDLVEMSDSPHTLSRFCQTELRQWATNEWEKISTVYEGGLNEVVQNTHALPSLNPALTIPDTLFASPQTVDFQRILQQTLVELPPKTRCQDLSFGGYIIKSLRTNWMMFASLMSIVGVLGVAALQPKTVISTTREELSNRLSGLLRLDYLITDFMVLSLLLVPLTIFILRSYLHDKTTKVDDAVTKLRKELNSYYQSLASHLVDRIIQDFTSVLELEQRRLEDIHTIVTEQLSTQLDGNKGQSVSKRANLEHLKHQQKTFQEERSILQKLKRLLG